MHFQGAFPYSKMGIGREKICSIEVILRLTEVYKKLLDLKRLPPIVRHHSSYPRVPRSVRGGLCPPAASYATRVCAAGARQRLRTARAAPPRAPILNR